MTKCPHARAITACVYRLYGVLRAGVGCVWSWTKCITTNFPHRHRQCLGSGSVYAQELGLLTEHHQHLRFLRYACVLGHRTMISDSIADHRIIILLSNSGHHLITSHLNFIPTYTLQNRHCCIPRLDVTLHSIYTPHGTQHSSDH